MSSKKKTSSPPKNASTPKPAPAASRVNPGHACARWDFAAKSRGLTRDELVHLAVENFLQISNYTARPETPLLDALEEAEAFCFEHQISRQGIFLPTPGLLGNVEIPQATALRFMVATTDNLNFGNPEKPEIMGQMVGAIQGIGEACIALDMPIVSGNVSLYNETDGKGILPTPTIGAVGVLYPGDLIAGVPQDGDLAVLIGVTHGHLGQSALLAEAFGMEAGDAPPVDLVAERSHGEYVRTMRRSIRAATDLSDGGLALAAFEMAEGAGLGVVLDAGDIPTLFGEDQARYLLACDAAGAAALMAGAVPCAIVGRFGGDVVQFGTTKRPMAALSAVYRGAFVQAVGV